jgi:hypothetical protein
MRERLTERLDDVFGDIAKCGIQKAEWRGFTTPKYSLAEAAEFAKSARKTCQNRSFTLGIISFSVSPVYSSEAGERKNRCLTQRRQGRKEGHSIADFGMERIYNPKIFSRGGRRVRRDGPKPEILLIPILFEYFIFLCGLCAL